MATMDRNAWVAVSYATCVPAAVLFAAYAMAFGWWHRRSSAAGAATTEEFVTARGTQNWGRIGWSFYAGAVGAWVVATPGQYASFAGIVGVVSYAVSSGFPILMIAFFGERITASLPHVYSMSDYVGWRYGPVAKTLAVLLAMFNLSIFAIAEYTTIGSLFKDFVGSVGYGIIVVVGVLTLTYTAYGGLLVSIATDQVQGLASVLLFALLIVYVAVTYRDPIPRPLGDTLGANTTGWVSLFVLPASLAASTVFSEAMWQRVWASSGRGPLHKGAAIGFALTTVIVFLSGFGGWLAVAAGRITDQTNANLYMIQVLSPLPPDGAPLLVSSWIHVIVLLLAIAMNTGAVDSAQNGLAASLAAHFFKNQPLVYARVAVVLLNIPLIVVGAKDYSVLGLFLVSNLLTCCGAIPVVAGLIKPLYGFLNETGMVVGFVSGVLALIGLGVGVSWVPGDVATSFQVGAEWAFYSNNYDWRAFAVALGCSTAGMLLWCSAAWLLRRTTGIKGVGISGVLMRIPGMKAVTATPHWTPEDVQLDVGHGVLPAEIPTAVKPPLHD